jgi:hypothetical protein
MRRRYGLVLAAAGVMAVIAALAQPKAAPRLLLLEWAGKASAETPPTAILIEMGMKDAKASPWSGRAEVTGAKVVHREGYRFREGDKLTERDGWVASSHRPLRLPPKNPAAAALEGMASVGVVLHLADVKPDAKLTLTVKDQEINQVAVPLKEVVAGQTQRLQGGNVAVRLISTATPVITAKTEDDFPAACYGPDGTLWVAYISYTVKEDQGGQSPYRGAAAQGAAEGLQGLLHAGVRRSVVREVLQGRQVERADRGDGAEAGPRALRHRGRWTRDSLGCVQCPS